MLNFAVEQSLKLAQLDEKTTEKAKLQKTHTIQLTSTIKRFPTKSTDVIHWSSKTRWTSA